VYVVDDLRMRTLRLLDDEIAPLRMLTPRPAASTDHPHHRGQVIHRLSPVCETSS